MSALDTGPDAVVAELRQMIHGRTVGPTDPDYDTARRVYNGAVDRRPAAVVRVSDVADVIRCVELARDRGLPLAVRGGGHHGAGFGVWDDALVIDLGDLRSVAVDPQGGTVRVAAGCTWAEVDRATGEFGLATPSGFVSTTGVAGLTLGGGTGYLTRHYGLTVDNLLSANVVLADGDVVTASATAHPDLFWALRGGGGNFGVVTSFTFACHPVGDAGEIVGGPVLYDLSDTEEVFRWYRDLVPALPDELNGWIGVLEVPSAAPFPEELWARKVCGIVWCYSGPRDRADEVLAPVREFGSPLLTGLAPMPYATLQSAFDGLLPAGLQWYWKADFFEEITDAAIALHRTYGESIPTPLSTMHLYPISGAASRVPADATAFAYRHGGWNGVIAGIDPDPANLAKVTDWARRYWEELHPTSAGGAYVNMMGDEGQERVRAAYRDNYERLVELKRRYDPHNLFRINQNIEPA
ncbi:FAD linked oxidase domain protein [Beutenbergia cavernae DSM 12333]|uniref:FAD linked oxidase domain protein n=1 Tax=Beutenbergia cavernae (strain ATCC BAA-8 / DSM 12333 / CCUG 43141 / JCM 11478 / NBRC 16432 / NCIMB 13614 / HKI 0122) TaxID=471853 RepID=C5BUW3_BEUC1|nr:FAD-binding oxidoreductase [Beutenbergia cavernae]ACQ78337.1 FAD linked oxidase domain protein [Beutenbergia cavernae DSM 12333]